VGRGQVARTLFPAARRHPDLSHGKIQGLARHAWSWPAATSPRHFLLIRCHLKAGTFETCLGCLYARLESGRLELLAPQRLPG
jgi:hypothetical protein